jgi:ankyrin repeat protein
MARKQPRRIPRPDLDEYGRAPLHFAAADGNASLVEDPLRSGVDVNAEDDDGWSPLHLGAQAGSTSVVTALLGAGADVTLRDRFGNTRLLRAVFCSRGEGGLIHLLRTAGADPDSPNNSGVSPLKLARTIANFDIARFFPDLP